MIIQAETSSGSAPAPLWNPAYGNSVKENADAFQLERELAPLCNGNGKFTSAGEIKVMIDFSRDTHFQNVVSTVLAV